MNRFNAGRELDRLWSGLKPSPILPTIPNPAEALTPPAQDVILPRLKNDMDKLEFIVQIRNLDPQVIEDFRFQLPLNHTSSRKDLKTGHIKLLKVLDYLRRIRTRR